MKIDSQINAKLNKITLTKQNEMNHLHEKVPHIQKTISSFLSFDTTKHLTFQNVMDVSVA